MSSPRRSHLAGTVAQPAVSSFLAAPLPQSEEDLSYLRHRSGQERYHYGCQPPSAPAPVVKRTLSVGPSSPARAPARTWSCMALSCAYRWAPSLTSRSRPYCSFYLWRQPLRLHRLPRQCCRRWGPERRGLLRRQVGLHRRRKHRALPPRRSRWRRH